MICASGDVDEPEHRDSRKQTPVLVEIHFESRSAMETFVDVTKLHHRLTRCCFGGKGDRKLIYEVTMRHCLRFLRAISLRGKMIDLYLECISEESDLLVFSGKKLMIFI